MTRPPLRIVLRRGLAYEHRLHGRPIKTYFRAAKAREKRYKHSQRPLKQVAPNIHWATLGVWVMRKFLVFVSDLLAESIKALVGSSRQRGRRRLTARRGRLAARPLI
jgi:hypothetical protein